MIRITLSVLFLLFVNFLHAQSTAGSMSYDKTERSVAMLELPYDTDVIKDALHKRLSPKGKAKGKEIKGFTSYKNPNPPATDSMDANLYFRVEEKSRKEKNLSIIYLLVTHQAPGESQTSELHHLNMEKSKELLNSLAAEIHAYALDGMIREQTEAVTKAAKKYSSLTEDGRDLEKKKISIEKDIISNQQEQNAQAAELELQKQKLSDLLKKKS